MYRRPQPPHVSHMLGDPKPAGSVRQAEEIAGRLSSPDFHLAPSHVQRALTPCEGYSPSRRQLNQGLLAGYGTGEERRLATKPLAIAVLLLEANPDWIHGMPVNDVLRFLGSLPEQVTSPVDTTTTECSTAEVGGVLAGLQPALKVLEENAQPHAADKKAGRALSDAVQPAAEAAPAGDDTPLEVVSDLRMAETTGESWGSVLRRMARRLLLGSWAFKVEDREAFITEASTQIAAGRVAESTARLYERLHPTDKVRVLDNVDRLGDWGRARTVGFLEHLDAPTRAVVISRIQPPRNEDMLARMEPVKRQETLAAMDRLRIRPEGLF